MSSFRVLRGASHRLDEIYTYTRDHWSEAQAEFGVDGFFCRYEKHFIY